MIRVEWLTVDGDVLRGYDLDDDATILGFVYRAPAGLRVRNGSDHDFTVTIHQDGRVRDTVVVPPGGEETRRYA